MTTKTGSLASNQAPSGHLPRPRSVTPVLPHLQTRSYISHRRVLEIEPNEQESLDHRRPVRERATSHPDPLWEGRDLVSPGHRRRHRENETMGPLSSSPLKRARQRPVKDRLGQINHRNSSEQNPPYHPRSHTTSPPTNQRSQKSTQGHPATGANAIKLPSSLLRRHIAVRTPQQLNRALLQLAGYENEGRK